MHKIILRRLLAYVPTVFFVTFLIFALIHFSPYDPAAILVVESDDAQALLEDLRHELGLDRPMLVQYADWLGGVARGDLGRSIRSRQKITEELKNRYPVTLELALGSMFLSLLIALPVGIRSAVRPYSLADNIGTTFAMAGVAIPSFWLAILLIYLFAVILGWFPASGYIDPWDNPWEHLRRMVLPVIASGSAGAASIMRQVRSAMLEVLRQDYIRTARSKGLRESVLLVRHAMRNAMIPVVTVIAIQMAFQLGGTVVIETMFGLPGIGLFAVRAAKDLDFPAVQGVLLTFAGIVILINLTVDILYAYLDPRIRYT